MFYEENKMAKNYTLCTSLKVCELENRNYLVLNIKI